MPRSNQARGRWGEDRAAAWYRSHGYTITARNWRAVAGEVDLIARRGDVVVVCEVKARRTDDYGPPSAAVGPVKQRRLRRLAAEWLAASGVHGVEVRFDVVTITGTALEVIENAF